MQFFVRPRALILQHFTVFVLYSTPEAVRIIVAEIRENEVKAILCLINIYSSVRCRFGRKEGRSLNLETQKLNRFFDYLRRISFKENHVCLLCLRTIQGLESICLHLLPKANLNWFPLSFVE